MKTLQIFVIALLFLGFACETHHTDQGEHMTHDEVDYASEQEAIFAVIDGESKAFWDKDYEAWASHWIHEPYIRTMGWWPDGGVTVVAGWDSRAERMKRNFEASPEPNPTANAFRRENVNIRIFRDVAWLTYDQYGLDTGDSLMDMPGLSRETRILEKVDGEWKIAYVGWLLEGPQGE